DREQSGVEAALEQAQALTPRIRPALLRQRSGVPPPCALRVPFVTNPSRGRLTPSLAEHDPVDPPREDAPADHGINVNNNAFSDHAPDSSIADSPVASLADADA